MTANQLYRLGDRVSCIYSRNGTDSEYLYDSGPVLDFRPQTNEYLILTTHAEPDPQQCEHDGMWQYRMISPTADVYQVDSPTIFNNVSDLVEVMYIAVRPTGGKLISFM